jgi:hypothetical protein
MPFTYEPTDKSTHSDIVESQSISAFLEKCEYDRLPTEEEGKALGESFKDVSEDVAEIAEWERAHGVSYRVLAIDGSLHDASINSKLMPSTSVGFVKVSTLLILESELRQVRVQGSRLVDPFRMAALRDRNDALVFSVPGTNIRYGGHPSARDGFRAALESQFADEHTRYDRHSPASSFRSTLFHVAAHMAGGDPGHPDVILLHRCPNPRCDERDVPVRKEEVEQTCPACGEPVYATDFLRLYEGVSDEGPSGEVLSRLMSVVEHILPVHHLRYLMESDSWSAISNLAVFIDGPLAIFGNAAKIHAGLMRFYYELNRQMDARDLPRPLVVGLQKTGRLAGHFERIKEYVGKSRLMPVSEEYRNKFITPGRLDDPSDTDGHGSETYYGQDFLYRSKNGGLLVLSTPYPFPTKASARATTGEDFKYAKARPQHYEDLARLLAMVERFETSLYPNALIPIALAHQFTAISLRPGGAALNILAERALRTQQQTG